MTESSHQKLTIRKAVMKEVITSTVIIGVLAVLGAYLVFDKMGAHHTQSVSAAFFAVVFFTFTVFQPAGTIYSLRRHSIMNEIELPPLLAGATAGPVRNVWAMVLPVSIPVGLVGAAFILGIVYATGWTPGAVPTVLLAMLYVIPQYAIALHFAERDLQSLAAGRLSWVGRAEGPYYWSSYFLPALALQSMINIPFGLKVLDTANLALEAKMPQLAGRGLIPVVVFGSYFASTFVFIAGFTFLVSMVYTLSGVYLGVVKMDKRAQGKRLNGWLVFLSLVVIGGLIGLVCQKGLLALGIRVVPFGVALALISLLILGGVLLSTRWAIGWTLKKIMARMTANAQKPKTAA